MIDDNLRRLEALLFAADRPLSRDDIQLYMPDGCDLTSLLRGLAQLYEGRGIELVQRAGSWHFQTASDLGHILRREREDTRKLSRAAVETLAIIAYHEPVTRAQIEEIRGVAISKGTLDVLMEAGWVCPAGRREAPGRPLLYATTKGFLVHFGLQTRRDLPGLADLKAAGLLEPLDLTLSVSEPGQEGPEDAEGAGAVHDDEASEPRLI